MMYGETKIINLSSCGFFMYENMGQNIKNNSFGIDDECMLNTFYTYFENKKQLFLIWMAFFCLNSLKSYQIYCTFSNQ